MASEESDYSIVVVGAMNPRIHHPTWYRNSDLISADAEEVAVKNKDLLCTKAASQFETARFRLACFEERWHIQTKDRELLEELVQLTGNVFDKKLGETPIRAFGLNFNHHRKTPIENVSNRFTELIKGSGFCVDELGINKASFTAEGFSEDRKTKVKLEPSVKSDDMLYLEFNFHYETAGRVDGQGHFELGPMLMSAFERDSRVADDICARIVGTLDFQPKEK